MTQLTSPDNIAKWTLQDPGSFVQASQTQGDSVQTALAKRQRYNYVWANDAARSAQTGMVEGSVGYQLDSQSDWIYRSSNWRLYGSIMQAFTPEFVNLNIGAGTAAGYVTVSGGWANVFITVVLGTGFNITSDIYAETPPIAPINSTLLNAGSVKIGFANFEDVSAGAAGRYEGTALLANIVAGTPYPNGVFRYGYVSSNIFNPITATIPFAFVAGDKLHLNVNYPVQA